MNDKHNYLLIQMHNGKSHSKKYRVAKMMSQHNFDHPPYPTRRIAIDTQMKQTFRTDVDKKFTNLCKAYIEKNRSFLCHNIWCKLAGK